MGNFSFLLNYVISTAKFIIGIPLIILGYFIISWALCTIVRKKSPETSMGGYFIPVLRYYLFVKAYNLPTSLFWGINASIMIIPAITLALAMGVRSVNTILLIPIICYVTSVTCLGVLWGRIGEQMGDKFNLWCGIGVIGAVSYILGFLTPIIFALSNCKPGGTGVIGGGASSAHGNDYEPDAEMSLTCVSGACRGKWIPASAGSATIGRSDTCDFVVPSPEISRVHAEIKFLEDHATIIDKSQNGIYIFSGTSKIRVNRQADIQRGDKFEIGMPPTKFKLC